MSNPRTAAITAFLRRYYREHPRVSCNSFAEASKRVLTGKEAREVFEYLTSIDQSCLVLDPSTKRIFTWICKQDHFNDVAVGDMLDFINLREKKDERHPRPKPIKTSEPEQPKVSAVLNMSLDELVEAIELLGWEVTLKHIRK